MKGANRQHVTMVVVGAILAACGVLALALSSTVMKDWIIIGYGIRVLSKVRLVGICLVALGAMFMIICAIPLIKATRRQKQQLDQRRQSAQSRSQVLANYAHDSTNPDFTRKRLEQLQDEMPELEDLVMQCLEQLDTMDVLQEKQNALIEANDARYLKDTVSVLDNVERRICQNFRNVINLCIAADAIESLDTEKVNKYLRDNRKKLSNTKELLKASADWINQYNAGEDGDRSEVENWITVIRNSLREE